MEHFSWSTLLGLSHIDHIIGLLVVLTFFVFTGLRFRKSISSDTSDLPSDKASFRNFVELVGIDFLLYTFLQSAWSSSGFSASDGRA